MPCHARFSKLFLGSVATRQNLACAWRAMPRKVIQHKQTDPCLGHAMQGFPLWYREVLVNGKTSPAHACHTRLLKTNCQTSAEALFDSNLPVFNMPCYPYLARPLLNKHAASCYRPGQIEYLGACVKPLPRKGTSPKVVYDFCHSFTDSKFHACFPFVLITVLVPLALLPCFGWVSQEARSSAEARCSPQVLGACLASSCRICLATASVPVELRISGVCLLHILTCRGEELLHRAIPAAAIAKATHEDRLHQT